MNAAQIAQTAAFDQALAEAAHLLGMDPAELREQAHDPRRSYLASQQLAAMSDDELRTQFGCGDELLALVREYQHINAF